MEAMLGFLYVALVTYLIPFLFAIGLIMFLYGCVNYYIIGPTEEPRKEEGRVLLLWAFLFFLTGLILYALVAAFAWVGTSFSNIGGDIDAGEQIRLQRVPDVPRENN